MRCVDQSIDGAILLIPVLIKEKTPFTQSSFLSPFVVVVVGFGDGPGPPRDSARSSIMP